MRAVLLLSLVLSGGTFGCKKSKPADEAPKETYNPYKNVMPSKVKTDGLAGELHCCTARSLRFGATSRLAALGSRLRKPLTCVRSLMARSLLEAQRIDGIEPRRAPRRHDAEDDPHRRARRHRQDDS